MNMSPDFLKSSASLKFGCLAIFLLSGCLASAGQASILTFDQIRTANGIVEPTISGNDLEDDYGDRITGSSVNVPGGQFTYGNAGEGYTPNVLADLFSGNGSPISLWQTNYGDLTNVAIGTNASLSLNLQLSADPGYVVDLYGFDLAGWSLADYTIDAVRVMSGTSTLFSQSNILVQGANDGGDMHTAFDFAVPLSGSDLLIQIDYGNLATGKQDNIGLDNIRFGQTPPPAVVPVPATIWLFGSGLIGLVSFSRNKKQLEDGCGP
jgi:hypothetical protein